MNKLLLPITLALSIFVSSNVHPQSADLDDFYYYDIGGSSATLNPGGYRQFDLIEANPDLSLNLNCGQFDVKENLEQLFDGFNNITDELVNVIVFAANSLVNDLPLLVLREAWPNLAKLFENAHARYEELIRIAIRDCKSSQDVILAGDNYFAGWVNISRGRKWKQAAEEGATATDTQAAVDTGEPAAIFWIDGEEKGVAEDIMLVQDLVAYGYEQLQNQAGSGGLGEAGRIGLIWGSADEAVEYAQRVLGEISINLDGPPSASPGEGAMPLIEEDEYETMELLTEYVNGGNVTLEQLEEISAPTVVITKTVLRNIRSKDAGARAYLINRLSNEIASFNGYERLTMLERILRTASREPHVVATPAFQTIENDLLPVLAAERQYLKDAAEMNQLFVSNTAKVLMEDYSQRRSGGPAFFGAPDDPKTSEGVLLRE